jgi:acyl-CoA thioester hydrolase
MQSYHILSKEKPSNCLFIILYHQINLLALYMEEFKPAKTLTLRIDWSELDLFKHVNNIVFYRYIQSMRITYFEEMKILENFDELQIGPILRRCACDFLKPLHCPGNVTIKSKLGFIGNTSFGFKYHLFNDDDELVAEGEDVIVYYDFNKKEKCPIPEKFKLKLESYNK